jgi:hypothetical protein
MIAHLLCTHRRTITGLLSTLGRQRLDWSKAYRLYQDHVDCQALFSPVIDGVLDLIPENAPLVIGVDDSFLKKSGSHVSGAGWYRDPMGPQFHANLIYAQRFIQLSAAIPDPTNEKRSRMIPVAVQMIPKIPKPSKDASRAEWSFYNKIKALNSPGAHARIVIQRIRDYLDSSPGHKNTVIWVCGDGDYSNATLLQQLPPRTVYIGRTRNDINLRRVPVQPDTPSVGRPLSYGNKLPTPDELRKDRSVPWQRLEISNDHDSTKIRYKHIPQAKWHIAGEHTSVQHVVIAPLRYRKRKNGPWTYTKPTYLVCTDTHIPVEKLIQAYFWRWGIEVNFKEEKQLFGAGHAQVRTSSSVSAAPAVSIATYAALLLAGIRAYGFHSRPPSVSPPKWYLRKINSRVTSSDLIKQVHQELLLSAAGNFSPLSSNNRHDMSSKKCMNHGVPL